MNFKRSVATENYMVGEVEKFEDIPEICEQLDVEGFQLIASFATSASFIKLIFRKAELILGEVINTDDQIIDSRISRKS